MNKKNRVRIRNEIVKALNNWQQFGCLVRAGFAPSFGRERRSQEKHMWKFVSGVAKDGRAILIYPVASRKDRVPFIICRLMLAFESRGALVGTACDMHDAYDIVVDDESQYKRKKKTRLHNHWAEIYAKNRREKNEGSEE